MHAASPGERIGILKLLRMLEFRQEIRRAEPGTKSRNQNRRQTSLDLGVIGNAGNKIAAASLPKWVLYCVRLGSRIPKTKLIHNGRGDHPVPANRQRVTLDIASPPGRGVGAIRDPTEEAGDESIAFGEGIPAEDVVPRIKLVVDATDQAILIVGN